MSSYLSSRRRFSEPEKPQPRFQWRLRVHSLMMDDSDTDNAPSLVERRAQRYDSRRDYRAGAELRAESRQTDRVLVPSVEDTLETYRYRRDRFTRTKSEGYLKLRFRLSRFDDGSKSLDDAESRADSEPDCRKSRSRHVGMETSAQAEGGAEASEITQRRFLEPQAEGRRGSDDVDKECLQGACGGTDGISGNVDELESKDESRHVSKGAIPKKFSDGAMRWDRSKLAEEEEDSWDDEEPKANVRDDLKNVQDETREAGARKFLDMDQPEPKEQPVLEGKFLHKETERATEKDTSPASDGAKVRGSDEGATGTANRTPPVGDKDKIDDIEAIIEQIIAEEEALLEGKERNTSPATVPAERISDDERVHLKNEMKELDENTDDDSNEKENENGIAITRSISQENHRSLSLPSYHSEGEHIKSVIPYSSSCPSESKDMNKDDDDDDDDDGCSWADLPVILLEDVFTLLTPKERHQASQVCRQWYDLFYSPRVWETFILLERTLTKKRFNLYKGYQRELCPGKTQLCFRRVGSFFKRIVVTPITDYFNLYEFLRILAAFLQYQEDHGQTAMPLLHTFDFTFACASRTEGSIMVHGTGGQILEMIKQLLLRMSNLKHLKLNQLLIDVMDVPSLFDAVANCFGDSLNTLEMLNVTKVPLALTELAHFRNLVKLTVSPQHLNEEVLLLLAGLNLHQLHLLQDPYTCECEPVSYEAWKMLREMAPLLHVYLEISGLTRDQLLIQPRAPVHGVFLRTPYSRLTSDLVMSLVEHYSKTLRYFVQERLPRIHGPRGFDSRCDSSLLFLVRRCPALKTLVVRERISTATLILLASEGKRLSTLVVRQNGLIKRCDWPQCGEWSKEFYSHLRRVSLDYDKCTDEICTLLRRRWRPMTDKQFMRLKIVPRLEMY